MEMRQSVSMTQELRMTPQLLQAIKLLQLSRQELSEAIREELEANPMLEEQPEAPPERAERSADEDRAERLEDRAERDAKEAVNEIDWERYMENYSSPLPAGGAGRQFDDLPGYDQTLSREATLAEHLTRQLGLLPASETELRIAEVIINSLDEEGYLRDISVPDLATLLGCTIDDVEDGLSLVQELDPTGVGARDLRECLLLQARQREGDNSLLIRLIDRHLPELETRNYTTIARALGISREEVTELHRTLTQLEPRPGRGFSSSSTIYITPDVYIVRRGDEWVPQLNDDGLPRLRVSTYYRKAVRASGEKEARQYVQERLNSAWSLLRAIEQRQETILKVTSAIIDFQRDFFDKGIHHLKPLVLRDVADAIGRSESTVSRVTRNKYVQTPRGLYELKFFFNSTISRDGGDDVAGTAVKHYIKQLIDSEPADRPHSDQKIADLLMEQHQIDIARRTVAKYRESMNILSSSRRKRFR